MQRENFDFKAWEAGLPEGTRVEGATFFRAVHDAEGCAEVWREFMRASFELYSRGGCKLTLVYGVDP
jgi:hypothetical protein